MPVLDTRFGQMAHESCGCRHAHHGVGASAFGGPSASLQYPPSLVLEPVHLEINISLDLHEETLKGRVVHVIVGRGDGARQLELDAVDFLGVKVRDLSGKALNHAYDGRKLKIVW